MKKILFITPQPFFEIRGTPIATKNMLEILSSKYKIDFISFPFGKKIFIKNVNQSVSWTFGFSKVKIGPSFKKIILDFGLLIKSLSFALSNDYLVVHANEESALIGVIIKKIKHIPLVYDMDSIMSEQIKNSKFAFITPLFELMEKIIIKNSDIIFGISKNFEPYCKKINPSVNFVEIWDVPQITKKKLPVDLLNKLSSKKKKVMYIGNAEKYQGVELLEKVADKMPELDFYFIGVGIDKIISNKHYIAQIPMEYVWGAMEQTDILVSPRLEGTNTPMKIYTYMASGKPIVATNIPAHKLLYKYSILVNPDTKSLQNGINSAFKKLINFNSKTPTSIINKYSLSKLKNRVINSMVDLND